MMEQIAYMVGFAALFGFFVFLAEKLRMTERELGRNLEELNELRGRAAAQQTALEALRGEVTELRESVKVRDKQEQALFEGMNSILNYSETVARKAAMGHGEGG